MSICLENVSFAYQEDSVLKKISLTIYPGNFLGILGPNGSGKTTLTYLFNGLIPHFLKGKLSGKVIIDGYATTEKGLSFFAKKVGMVFQNPDFSLFNLTVKEEIAFGLENFGIKNKEEKIKEALKKVGLPSFSERNPQTLSFGQKQKVALASVLALETPYLVLDEPTAMLDYKSSLELYQILSSFHQKGKTIVVVEHETDFLWRFSQEILVLDQGEIRAFGPTKKILKEKKLLLELGLKIPSPSD